MKMLKKYGISIPKILLPNKDISLEKWAVIACDQYTQDTEYWKKASAMAKNSPSTIEIVLPEVYLHETEKKEEHIKNIHRAMQQYIDNTVFQDELQAFVYIERKTTYGRTRKGLVVAIDLECYDWKPFTKNLIRSTEATIIERIPPRVAIRKGAPIESPHIMLLVNDSDKVLVEKTGKEVSKNETMYDTDLMLNGGHITGWEVSGSENITNIAQSLELIAKKNTETDGSVFMFAVGDGNHSLATAKAVWDEIKKDCKDLENANERFALVEIVNIFDDGLTFEPIHRVLFNSNIDDFLNFTKDKWNVEIQTFETFEKIDSYITRNPSSFAIINSKNGKTTYTCVSTDKKGLLISHLQPLIDAFMKDKAAEDIDYIHGSDEVCRLAQKKNTLGLFLPPIEKDSFFATIEENGPLPRKSFSMGEADEKRFYMECRKLIN